MAALSVESAIDGKAIGRFARAAELVKAERR
jgi:hypothetical protein